MNWPIVTPEHRDAVMRVLSGDQLTEGPEADALEEEFAEYAGRRYAVSVSSGTTAIEVALAAAGIRRGDKVAIPAYTFSGSALGALHLGAEIDWVDVDHQTFLAEGRHWPKDLETAIVVHLFGQAAPTPKAKTVIEDCAQAFGSSSLDGAVGQAGIAACWSLNQTKTVWGGEGGIIATDDEGLADDARSIRCYGGVFTAEHPKAHNWKLAEIPAALARVSLRNVDEWIERARDAARAMDIRLSGHPYLSSPIVRYGRRHVYHQYRVTKCGLTQDWMSGGMVPWQQWQATPLPGLVAFGGQTDLDERFPGAMSVCANTFTLGGDRHPPCSWEIEEIDRWDDLIWESVGS